GQRPRRRRRAGPRAGRHQRGHHTPPRQRAARPRRARRMRRVLQRRRRRERDRDRGTQVAPRVAHLMLS
ncbi:hypothetical protein MNEG_2809, partial [Monoraphidium neglectum]